MKKSLILLVGMALFLTACTQDTTLGISTDIASYQFDAAGGSFDAIIFTNGSWTATCDDAAVSFTPSSGDCSSPIHISVAPNAEHYTKSIRITLTTTLDNLSRTGRIAITQSCAPFIFSEEELLRIPASGGKARFQVNANESWKVTGTACDGEPVQLTVDPIAHGPNLTDVTVQIPENPLGRDRVFTVELSLESFPLCTLLLTVVQAA